MDNYDLGFLILFHNQHLVIDEIPYDTRDTWRQVGYLKGDELTEKCEKFMKAIDEFSTDFEKNNKI